MNVGLFKGDKVWFRIFTATIPASVRYGRDINNQSDGKSSEKQKHLIKCAKRLMNGKI